MATKETLEYYEFNDIMDTASTILGKDLRDFAGMFAGKESRDDVEYQDFWHWWLENVLYDECYNGMIQHHANFSEILEDAENSPEWVHIIIKTMMEILGDDADVEINLMYSW